MELNYYFAKLEKTWQVDFTSDTFWDTSDKITRKMWGFNLNTGIVINPLPEIFVSGFYANDFKLISQDHDANSVTRSSLDALIQGYDYDKIDIDMPEYWGIGLSYIFKTKFRVTSDFVSKYWSKLKINGTTLDRYNDSSHLGFGFEILPTTDFTASYFRTLSYRVGYYHDILNYKDINSNIITENGFTIGLGVPYYYKLGRIDFAFKYGFRGDLTKNPVEENVFQFLISITGGEKWFERGLQK